MAAFGNTGRAALLASAIALAGVSTAHAQAAMAVGNFADSSTTLTHQAPAVTATATSGEAAGARFANLTAPDQASPDQSNADQAAQDTHQIELELHAPGTVTGLDVSIAQRASFGADANGDLNQRGRGSEVRVGHALGLSHHNQLRDPNSHRIYAFAASDDQALTWAPGTSHVALQDQVQIGDHQAGVTYEHGNVQASLAYVEREVSTTVGRQSFSKNENFAGVTLTMRH